MSQLVAAIFPSKASALAALGMLEGAGYLSRRVVLLAQDVDRDGAGPVTGPRYVSAANLVESGELVLPMALKGAVVGSAIVFFLSIIFSLLLVKSLSHQLMIISMVWKVGGMVGSYVGLAVGYERGMSSEMIRYYSKQVELGRVVLATRVRRRHLSNIRGILLESGALEVRDVQGSFEAKRRAAPKVKSPSRS